MSARVAARMGPPLSVVGPFFFVAPIGLAASGVVLFGMSGSDLGAYNHPHVLAFVHTLVLGWVTLTIFGATYQLGAAVLRAPEPNRVLLRLQLAVHLAGVVGLVLAFRAWNLDWLHWAPALILLSVGAHIWTVQRLFRPASDWSPTRVYLLVSNMALVLTVLVGALWAQLLDGSGIAVTPSRIAAHAHIGLVGWLALTLMGIFYQLVPMFMLVGPTPPRFARYALGLTTGGLFVFFVATLFQQSATWWMGGVIAMAAGCSLWFADQILALKNRRRRKPDFYFVSILVSLGFFVSAVGLGVAAAASIAANGLTGASTRLLLAYFVTGVIGWMGTALVANSYKIVPFLVWYHRYSGQAGKAPVPLLADMFSLGWAKFVVATHVAATLILVVAVLTHETLFVMIAAAGLVTTGLGHSAGLLTMLLPKRSSRPAPIPRRGVVKS